MREKHTFHFKQFSVRHDKATMKVGTDGVLLGAWVNMHNARRILDIGTGTGVIALMMAQRSGKATVIEAIEPSADDAGQARENFGASPWSDRLNLHHTSLQTFDPPNKYDLIVSNPPFFNHSLPPPEAKRKNARHTSTLTQEELLQHSIRILDTAGHLNMILPSQESNRVANLAIGWGIHCTRRMRFKTRKEKPIERVLMEFSFQKTETEETELILYEKEDTWSEQYRQLTEPFYLTR